MIDQNQIKGTQGRSTIADDIAYVMQNANGGVTKEEFLKRLIKIQYKYDIALNMVKNYCSDFFVDVLQDASNISEIAGCAYFNTLYENIASL